jgi:ubiquinone/menaquinone biosynthesis C-methylase UbiE
MAKSARKKIAQRYYSIRAKDYDEQKSRTWKSDQGFGAEVFEEMLNAFKGFGNKVLLEVGVGSGRNAKPTLEKIRPRLIGLDLTKEMLNVTRKKMSAYKEYVDLIQGDAERLPFVPEAFDGILCMSTMHYLENQEEIMEAFAELLKNDGIFAYGDLSPHESDNQELFETLEKTISKAHKRYYKASEMQRLLKTHGFSISKIKTIVHRKTYDSLNDDKARYFGIKPKVLHRYVEKASKEAKQQYSLTTTELTFFYTVIVATRKNETA